MNKRQIDNAERGLLVLRDALDALNEAEAHFRTAGLPITADTVAGLRWEVWDLRDRTDDGLASQ